jgi:hypothetical protein
VIPASLAFLLHIPYVRIDCDIYLPALDCLNYLGSRLAGGAILVFDDWPRLRGYGEQRASKSGCPPCHTSNLSFSLRRHRPLLHPRPPQEIAALHKLLDTWLRLGI